MLLLREARTAVISQKVSGICFILEKGRLEKRDDECQERLCQGHLERIRACRGDAPRVSQKLSLETMLASVKSPFTKKKSLVIA